MGFSWFGERSGGILWVGEDVGERWVVGNEGRMGKECLMKETGVTREQGKDQKNYDKRLKLDCCSLVPESHTLTIGQISYLFLKY